MGTKFKAMLLEKLPIAVHKESILRQLRNVNVSYKHNEKCFVINLSNKFSINDDHSFQNLAKGTSSQEQVQCSISRDILIPTVLNDIVNGTRELNNNPKQIVMDFSSPNIAKPFHAGHLRSTIIGNYIANINRHFGNKVTKINYLGDWGTQFGLLQYGLQEKNIDIDALKNDPIRCMYDAYVYANKMSTTDASIQQLARKYFSDIEQGNSNLDTWKKIRILTVQELKKVYERLGIHFDAYHWESDYNGGAIKELMKFLEEKSIIKRNDSGQGVVTVKNRDVTVLKSDNSTLYLSRDIAALLDRYKKYNFDKMLYIVDNAQSDHFATLFEVVKQIKPECVDGCEHIKFGRIKGMSTRTGNVVFLNDILDEAKRKMHEKQKISKNTRTTAMNDKTCDILGTSAVIVNDLKQRRQKDYTFDWNRALQSEGDCGIKLQYLHCRLWSLEQNCGVPIPDFCDPNYIPEEIIGEVISELAKFEGVLCRSLLENEACIIVNYLFCLARYVNRMFNELNVKNVNTDLAMQRLLVFNSARIVVKTGLEILGLQPLQEM